VSVGLRGEPSSLTAPQTSAARRVGARERAEGLHARGEQCLWRRGAMASGEVPGVMSGLWDEPAAGAPGEDAPVGVSSSP
jgi:hypothetical protein